MADYQDEAVTRIYASMKKVGGEAVVTYALDVAADSKEDAKRRQAALAALEGHIDRKNDDHIKKLLAIAKSDAPALVIDQAFRRVRELPREGVARDLYAMFDTKDWKIRRLAAATILQMSEAKDIDEFLSELAKRADKNFNLPEAITYGAYLATLKGGKILDKLEPHMKRGDAKARLAAISYWYEKGTKNDLGAISSLETDGQSVPTCADEDQCDWSCLVPTTGDKKESKTVKTVGDFVSYCIKPKMQASEPEKKDAEKGDQGSNEKKDEEKK